MTMKDRLSKAKSIPTVKVGQTEPIKLDTKKNREILHPRPQLARARWVDLGGTWGFAYDDSACGFEESWQQRTDVYIHTIQVPFPPESSASGINDNSFHPIVWYRRTFEVAHEDAGK